jgi:UDPglucose--hexose-1-phosphate uridylyltransferase
MAELRYHPLIDDWVMIASHRQDRPQMPKDWCPFCPGSGKVPDDGYDVYRYPNDFPALSVCPPVPDPVDTALFKTAPAYGRCDVLLYSPEHRALLRNMQDEHMGKLANLWLEVFNDMAGDTNISYVFIFENRGEAVGVTMPHPHGQAYGYSIIPKKIQLEIDAAARHRAQTGRCLFCDILAEEKQAGSRIIFENEAFTVYLPFYSEYPYGVYIMSREHVRDIRGLSPDALKLLGLTVRDAAGMLDSLFDNEFPYMMCMHNGPVNSGDCDFHFHIEFFPPMRSETKQKFNASSETGAWAHCNPTCPEEKAAELRAAYQRYKKNFEKHRDMI